MINPFKYRKVKYTPEGKTVKWTYICFRKPESETPTHITYKVKLKEGVGYRTFFKHRIG